ncbi:type II toxin-antitoxin system RelE/ParE family toxin [Sphingomonas sp.]|uniref:type II toxin-antitoxin system RelE/ParE family toxin n=1 Tax=Sphingomonas sp. TaxID=28214 RepID=UPI002ED79219
MIRLVWSKDAQSDLRALTLFYAQIMPDLPERLIARIEEAAAKLIDFPRLGPELPDSDVRSWAAKGTPFLLLYRVTPDSVRILKVRDARTDWKPRA